MDFISGCGLDPQGSALFWEARIRIRLKSWLRIRIELNMVAGSHHFDEEHYMDPHPHKGRVESGSALKWKVMRICKPVLYTEFVWAPCQQLHAANVGLHPPHSVSFSCLSLFIRVCYWSDPGTSIISVVDRIRWIHNYFLTMIKQNFRKNFNC